jgi:hypothetical protein
MHGLRVSNETFGNRAEQYRQRFANIYLSEVQQSPSARYRKRRDRSLAKTKTLCQSATQERRH